MKRTIAFLLLVLVFVSFFMRRRRRIEACTECPQGKAELPGALHDSQICSEIEG